MRILVVEDDALLADGLSRALTSAGHVVEHVASGRHADLFLRQEQFDVVVLDVVLPDIDGFEVLRRFRSRRATTNVLVLTARDTIEDRVHGLNLGADDYLTKPFSVEEFEARVRAMSRRLNAPAAQLSVGGMNVDVARRRFTIHDRSIDLTPREWALLELFLARPGRVLSKEQIAHGLVAFDGHLSVNAVENHVSRLRVKIESSSARIRTVRGFGYVWDSGDE